MKEFNSTQRQISLLDKLINNSKWKNLDNSESRDNIMSTYALD